MSVDTRILDKDGTTGIYELDTRRMVLVERSEMPGELPLQNPISREELEKFFKILEVAQEIDVTLSQLSSYSSSFWPLKYINIVRTSNDRYLVFDRYWKTIANDES